MLFKIFSIHFPNLVKDMKKESFKFVHFNVELRRT